MTHRMHWINYSIENYYCLNLPDYWISYSLNAKLSVPLICVISRHLNVLSSVNFCTWLPTDTLYIICINILNRFKSFKVNYVDQLLNAISLALASIFCHLLNTIMSLWRVLLSCTYYVDICCSFCCQHFSSSILRNNKTFNVRIT